MEHADGSALADCKEFASCGVSLMTLLGRSERGGRGGKPLVFQHKMESGKRVLVRNDLKVAVLAPGKILIHVNHAIVDLHQLIRILTDFIRLDGF